MGGLSGRGGGGVVREKENHYLRHPSARHQRGAPGSLDRPLQTYIRQHPAIFSSCCSFCRCWKMHPAHKVANPFPPLQPSKTPETPNLSEICPSVVFGVPVRGTEIWKNLSKFVRKLPFFKFRQIFPNFSPPDWNPQKQSLGQTSDKFGVSGVFEGCKGEKGSQHMS